MTRDQYRLLDQLTRLLRRAHWRIDSPDVLVMLIVQTDMALVTAGLDLRPPALDWYVGQLPRSER